MTGPRDPTDRAGGRFGRWDRRQLLEALWTIERLNNGKAAASVRVAITGLGCHVPGCVADPESFRRLLRDRMRQGHDDRLARDGGRRRPARAFADTDQHTFHLSGRRVPPPASVREGESYVFPEAREGAGRMPASSGEAVLGVGERLQAAQPAHRISLDDKRREGAARDAGDRAVASLLRRRPATRTPPAGNARDFAGAVPVREAQGPLADRGACGLNRTGRQRRRGRVPL